VKEWQPFWKNLTGQIASLSQRYLTEQKEKEGWLSHFLPSSNSAKKDSSKSSSPSPLQNYELEAESVVKKATPDIKAATKKPVTKKTVTKKQKPEIDKELEAKLRSKLEEQLTSELEIKLTTKLKVEIEAELKLKLEAELKEQIEVDLRIKLEQEFEEKLKQKIKAEELLDPETKSEPVTAFETKQKTESKSKELIDFDMDTKRIVEAILFAADKPMTSKQVRNVYPELERPELQEIQFAINSIIEDYAPRPIGLKLLASGYSFQVKDGFSYWVSRLFEEKPPKYSRALLETIAIIAYRQPVTRGDIEDIRGVSVSSNIIRTLMDREWIRIIAHKEVPGRPALYGTTKQFLDYFNLSSLDQLPPIDEIKNFDFSSGNPLVSKNISNDDPNYSQENIAKEQQIEEQTSEEQKTEKQPNIDPISETRH
jgi:segregation and condensation protein B